MSYSNKFLGGNVAASQSMVSDDLWAGTETSHIAYVQRLESIAARILAGVTYEAGSFDQTAADLPYLLSVDNGIATIAIKGPMTNTVSYYDKYDNAATYPAIREALISAAKDTNVKQILLDVDSGGGAVSGVSDVANLISMINSEIKPVTAFTDANMFSAAYWLSSSAGAIYASKIAGVGSIGVLAVHQEASKMMDDVGIKTTVIRSGEFKALANRFEPLTAEARAQIQASCDATYTVFVQHVADSRNVPYATADTKMAQGREFHGDGAYKAGLVDGILSFDEMASKLQSSIDNGQATSHNSRNITTGKKIMAKSALTAKDVALLALTGVAVTVGAEATAEQQAALELAEKQEKEAAEAAEAKKVAEAKAATEQAAAQAASGAASKDAVQAYLQGQIITKDAALLEANVKISALEAKVADTAASTDALVKIAAQSAKTMRIALNLPNIDVSAMTATAILADHDAVSKQFTATFPVGGIAAVASTQTKEATVQDDSLRQARIAATRSTNVKSK